MYVIHALPCLGKTTLQDYLRGEGVEVFDTDYWWWPTWPTAGDWFAEVEDPVARSMKNLQEISPDAILLTNFKLWEWGYHVNLSVWPESPDAYIERIQEERPQWVDQEGEQLFADWALDALDADEHPQNVDRVIYLDSSTYLADVVSLEQVTGDMTSKSSPSEELGVDL